MNRNRRLNGSSLGKVLCEKEAATQLPWRVPRWPVKSMWPDSGTSKEKLEVWMFARSFLVLEEPHASYEIWLHAGCDLQSATSRNSPERRNPRHLLETGCWETERELGGQNVQRTLQFYIPSLIVSTNTLTHIQKHFNF